MPITYVSIKRLSMTNIMVMSNRIIWCGTFLFDPTYVHFNGNKLKDFKWIHVDVLRNENGISIYGTSTEYICNIYTMLVNKEEDTGYL